MTARRSPERPQPHIVTGDGTTSPAHRLLLITAAFPPDPRSGSLRWQKLSRYAAERGWGLDVITTDPAEIEFPDPALVRALPLGIRVFGVRSSPPRVERFARARGLPFVMDMRDPWSLVERVPGQIASPVWFAFAKRFERRAVADAAIVATNTEPFRRAMCDHYPNVRARILTVMNGCDEDAVPPSQHGPRFVIGYAGAIYL